jgi:hypothetical protein
MSGWQVNRGGSINNGRVPTAEAPPSYSIANTLPFQMFEEGVI